MPVYTLHCPDCDHRFKGMVMAHTEPPREWVCSKCGSHRAAPPPDAKPERDPWEGNRTRACPCCG